MYLRKRRLDHPKVARRNEEFREQAAIEPTTFEESAQGGFRTTQSTTSSSTATSPKK
jgi:hypothetical protein